VTTAGQRVIDDRYVIHHTLGEGGMARVYLATDRVLDRRVALKVLAERYAGDDRFVARFRREAHAAAGLNHPNIVRVFDTGDDGAAHYIVMEYVDGETVADILLRDGPAEPDRAARIARRVATALQAAHDQGLVHRDVKPGNVMVDRDGRIMVMDFGIARAAADDTLTQAGTVLGTAAYLSPEQARGDPVDARSDVYSLGCVLYEMLCGRPPFTGASAVSIAYRHVNDVPDPPSAHRRGIPAAFDAVTMRALAKDPDDRYRTAEEMGEALIATEGGEVATNPIHVGGGDTEVLPLGPSTTQTAPPNGASDRRRTLSWLPVVLAGAVLAGVLALQLADDEGTAPGQNGARGQATAEQASPPPEGLPPSEVALPGIALGELDDVLTSSVNDEMLTLEAARKIASRADKAGDHYAGGRLDVALQELVKAHAEVDKALSKGDLSEEAALPLHQAIDGVTASMAAAPPQFSSTDGDDEDDDE
jgi:eukaryotic-like serine/threonine-protein kinase